MERFRKLLTLGVLAILSFMGVIGCNGVDKSDIEFDLGDFENEMKSRGYEYKRQDLQEGLVTPVSQYLFLDDNMIVEGSQVILYDTDVIIYSYENNELMENEASNINKDASQIITNNIPVEIVWPKTPHFYKKGKIISQYTGDDEKVISDLKEIMGEQFAGRE